MDIVNLKKKSGKISYSEKSYKNFESFYGCSWRSICKAAVGCWGSEGKLSNTDP